MLLSAEAASRTIGDVPASHIIDLHRHSQELRSRGPTADAKVAQNLRARYSLADTRQADILEHGSVERRNGLAVEDADARCEGAAAFTGVDARQAQLYQQLSGNLGGLLAGKHAEILSDLVVGLSSVYPRYGDLCKYGQLELAHRRAVPDTKALIRVVARGTLPDHG